MRNLVLYERNSSMTCDVLFTGALTRIAVTLSLEVCGHLTVAVHAARDACADSGGVHAVGGELRAQRCRGLAGRAASARRDANSRRVVAARALKALARAQAEAVVRRRARRALP